MEDNLPIAAEALSKWEDAFYAFLAENERRSGSLRTVDAYSRMLQRFFGTLGKTPEQIGGPDVFSFAHGIGPSGRKPASITIGARLACVSSFYRFLIRMKIVETNPCDQLERPRVSPAPPRGLTGGGDPATAGRHPGDTQRPAGPRYHHHTCPDGPAALGGAQPEGRRHHPDWRPLLSVPGQGRKAGQA